MSEPIAPIFSYPKGNEIISTNSITISWNNTSFSNNASAYDIFFTDNYLINEEPNWQQIASVPPLAESYVWQIPSFIKSSKCRLSIRAKNARGERSDYNITPNNFSIRNKKLSSPTVISPISEERYDRFIEIILDESGIIDTASQRSYYQICYSSDKLNIPQTYIAQNVPIGAEPVLWNTSNLLPSEDYELQIFLKDNDGNISDKVIIKNITIAHEGFFIVDTIPPIAAVSINDNKTFTNKQEINVNILSHDTSTGVHSLILTDGDVESNPDTIANVKRFLLSEENGIKYVQAKLQDFGGNRSDDNNTQQRIFEVFVENTNTEFVDLTLDKDTNNIWAISKGDINGIYKINEFPSLILNTSKNLTAVAFYKYALYVATSEDNKGTLNRFDGAKLVDSYLFESADSYINALTVHDDLVFIGMENGDVYKFDGLTYSLIQNFSNPISYLYSDGNLLYLVQRNSFDIYVYNGSSFFTTGG